MRLAFALLILVASSVPARADVQRSADEMRAEVAALGQRYADLERLHPEIYSRYPVIELVTMGVGSLIWERHGHIALCVRYSPARKRCFNYGIGDFDHALGMVAGFLRGKPSFWVGEMDAEKMLASYVEDDRTVWVQPLPLTDDEKHKVIAKLAYDVQEEHKAYAYDHFSTNCTTRVRDDLDEATGGKLKALVGPHDDRTYRDLARQGFFGWPIMLLVTDLVAGRVTDRVPTYWEKMFLPDYLREAAQKAWGITPVAIYERHGPPPLDHAPSGRIWFALLALVMTAPAWLFARFLPRFRRVGLALSVLPYWLLGTVLWLLAIITPLPYLRWNESCLVFLPTDLLLVWFLSPARRITYATFRVGMLVLIAALLVVNVLEQPLWPQLLFPLVPALVVAFETPRQTDA